MRVLVAIANYGTSNRKYLDRLVAEYRSMPWHVDIVVLTEQSKDLPDGVEPRIGLPDPHEPWSLPFAHRALFAERRDDYDLFIYSEDDTLVRRCNVEAFIRAASSMASREIAGFLRSEVDEAGRTYVSSAHAFFRWIPTEITERAGEQFAAFSNDHAACYMVTREQLAAALASGRFLVPPHTGRYDMLCAAATDIYTQCGLKRLVCVSRLREFLLPHLANKYIGRIGVPLDEVEAQVAALRRLARADGWKGPLIEIETALPFGLWSKDLYERPDPRLLALVPRHAKSVLSVGTGWAATEAALTEAGRDVTAIPVDPVFGDAARRAGIRTIEGSVESVVSQLGRERFDCLLLADVLHLVPDPPLWLRQLRPLLTDGGCAVISVPNTRDVVARRGAFGSVAASIGPHRDSWGVRPTSGRVLREWLKASGLHPDVVRRVVTGRRRLVANASLGTLSPLLASRLLGRGMAVRREDPKDAGRQWG